MFAGITYSRRFRLSLELLEQNIGAPGSVICKTQLEIIDETGGIRVQNR